MQLQQLVYFSNLHVRFPQEPDQLMASIGLATNVIDQLYYPIEKMAWLAENKLIAAEGGKWDTISSAFWVASIYLTLMR